MSPEPAPLAAPVANERPSAAPAPAPLKPIARLALIVASVVLLRLTFAPFGLAPLALVAIAPFLYALDGLSTGRAFLWGLLFGTLSGAANASWFVSVFTGSDLWFCVPLWLLIGIWPALYAVGHALASRRGTVALAVLAPALWIAQEWVRSEGQPLRFAWFTLGHGLSGSEWFRQSADLAGVYGLSLLCFGTSFLLERAFRMRRDGRGLVLGFVAVAVALVAWARGANMIIAAGAPGNVPEGRRAFTVAVVQDEHSHSLEPKTELTKRALARGPVEAVVWPEESFQSEAWENASVRNGLAEVAKLTSGVLVVGTEEPTGEKDASGAPLVWNSALLLRSDGTRLGTYHKRQPVQFIEPVVADTKSPVFEVNGVKVGVLICYDGTYPFVTRDLVSGGAQVILTPSMDIASWGILQHLHHASFYPLRACEVRRPIVRACSSGVSLVLDPWGRSLARIEPFDPGFATATVVPEDAVTPYVRGGWLLPYVALAISGLGALAGLVKRQRKQGI